MFKVNNSAPALHMPCASSGFSPPLHLARGFWIGQCRGPASQASQCALLFGNTAHPFINMPLYSVLATNWSVVRPQPSHP
jgi:hypothetical protein